MDVRDSLAAAALQALIANERDPHAVYEKDKAVALVKSAYAIADLMLYERGKARQG